MLQREIYFFGKLNQSRDFIVSANLEADDKNFWDGWFGRCVNQNGLIPFVKKSFVVPRIWLFCIKLPDGSAYTGLTALSSDLTGRRYPFLLFCKLSSFLHLSESIHFIAGKTDFFRHVLSDGKCTIQEKDFFNTDGYLPSNALSEPFLSFLSNNTSDKSFWVEDESGRYVEHDGQPSCALFNKLFGL